MHRRMIWYSFQPEHLIETQPQQDLQGDLLRSAPCFASDEPVQCFLPPHRPINQFLHKAPIRLGKTRTGQPLFEDLFNKATLLRMLLQELDGNFSWFFCHPPLIMSVGPMVARIYFEI